MQFNSHPSNFDIVSDIDFWAGSDSDSYPIAAKTRNANLSYDHVVTLILQADGRWEWDDTNATDLPIATATLTSGQQDYGIDTDHLKILRVAIKDAQGRYYYLDPLDDRAIGSGELMDRDDGRPTAYKKVGNSIILDRAPTYTATAGIKVYFQRNVSYFTTADEAKTPGFAEPYHRLLSLGAAADYCAVNDLDKRYEKIKDKIRDLEASLIAFYSQRSRDERPRLAVRKEDYGAAAML
jgi:hypothetical protein